MFGEMQSKTYIKIFSDGTLRQKVSETTEGAVRRDYELKDGTRGTVYEKVYRWVEGFITHIQYSEGQFGTQVLMDITGTNGDKCCLTFGADSKFAGAILEKLPNLFPEETVRIQPYAYEKDGKNVAGVTIVQNGEKVESFFKQWDDKKKAFKYLAGFPEPDTSNMNKDKWKVYFAQTRVWLREYLEKNTLAKFDTAHPEETAVEAAPEDEPIDLSSIPF